MISRQWRRVVTPPILTTTVPTATARPRYSTPRRRNMATHNQASPGPDRIFFGPHDVTTQVFLRTPLSFALVNIKPLMPGHVLVCPTAPHRRLTDLSAPELADLFAAVQRVQRMLAVHYFSASAAGAAAAQEPTGPATAAPEAGSFNIALQDGPEAGQTVAHVHVHVLPRIRGRTAKDADSPGDALYEHMAQEVGNVGGALWDRARGLGRGVTAQVKDGEEGASSVTRPKPGGMFPRIEDAERQARTMAEMEEEARVYGEVLQGMEEG